MSARDAARGVILAALLVTAAVIALRVGRAPLLAGGTHRVHVVAAGETLSAIAAQELGDAGRWRELARWNELSDPHRIEVGAVLVLEEEQTERAK